MSNNLDKYLNIGCGKAKINGFINIDLDPSADLQLDIRNGLPFPNETIQAIYSEHFIEHLTQPEIISFLRECRRVLSPNGKLRIATPDLDEIAIQFTSNDWQQPWLEKYGFQWIRNRAEYLNISLREWGHSWVVNEEELCRLAELAGLNAPSRCEIGQSSNPALEGLETRTESTLIMEFGKRHNSVADQPLVTIVIPAYKPNFFSASLESAINQTYPLIEILVLDDSAGDEIKQICNLLSTQDKRITYIKNTPALGEPDNLTHGIRLAHGEFIKPLYDDDLLFPEAVAQLVFAFQQAPEARMAAGQRLPIDSADNNLDKETLGPLLATTSGLLNGSEVIGQIAASGVNNLGEPTIMMFRRADALAINEPNVMSLFGRLCYGIGDVCLASHLLSRGDLAYLAHPIAYFRIHPDQAQQRPGFREIALASWAYFKQHAARLGLNPPKTNKCLNDYSETKPHRVSIDLEKKFKTPLPPRQLDSVKVTAIFVCYEQKNLVLKALNSLINQDYPIDEIIISDDGSTDCTFEAIRSQADILQGKCRKLLIRQNPQNLGIIPHFNLAFGLASNEFIVYFAGDDISEPYRIRRQAEHYLSHGCPKYYLTHSDVRLIGQNDTLEEVWSPPVITRQLNLLDSAISLALHIGATAAFTRALWADYGKFEQNWIYEDLVLGWRAAIHDQYHYIPEPLVRYRAGGITFQAVSNTKDRRHRLGVYRQRLADTVAATAAGVRNDLEEIKVTLQEQISTLINLYALSEYDQAYADWLTTRYFIPEDIGIIENSLSAIGPETAKFHVFLRVPPGAELLLADTLDSLSQQLESNWHLDIVTNAPSPDVLNEVQCINWHTIDNLDKVKKCINSLVETRVLDWVIELPAGAKLDPLFLWRLAEQAKIFPETYAFFVDDDCQVASGQHNRPRFKPGVNPAALISSDLAGPLCVRRDIWQQTGGASNSNGSPWFSQLLRVAKKFGWSSIKHIPDVLISYSGVFPSDTKSCLLALIEHHANTKTEGEIVPVTGQSWSIRYSLQTTPKISIAIISRGQLDLLSRCLESIIVKTSYPNFEFIIAISNEQDDPEFDAWLISAQQSYAAITKVIKCATGANHAIRCNAAIKATTNDFALLIREEAVIIQDKWLEELVRTGLQPDIAGVSPCLIAPGTAKIQEAGYVLGLKGPIGSPYQGEAKLGDNGYLDQLRIARDVSALSGACMLVRTAPYLAVGGMNEVDLGDNYADADLCLKLRSPTQRLIYQPFATVVYGGATTLDIEEDAEQSAQRTIAKEHAAKAFSQRWLPLAAVDPFWNTNLSLANLEPTPETDYRAQWQFLPSNTPRILACSFAKGESFFRIDSALTASRKAGLASECYWPQDKHEPSAAELIRLAPDTVIVQHYLKNKQLAALQDWSTAPGRPFIVYTIDDLITNMAESNSLRLNIPANARTRLKYALARCDRMVVSTDFLAESYRHLIKDIRVVPNRLEKEIWLPLRSRKRTGKKPRIGWAGGRTHQDDLQLLKEVIEQTLGEADWIFFGMCPDEIRPLLSEYHPYTTLAEYPSRLAALNLDIAVAPLAQIPFNQAKSNLRLLEYGILGIPVVCSDIDPYRGSPACCVENTKKAWTTALRQRIHDTKAREREGSRMRQWVIQHYLQEDHLNDWLSAHLPD